LFYPTQPNGETDDRFEPHTCADNVYFQRADVSCLFWAGSFTAWLDNDHHTMDSIPGDRITWIGWIRRNYYETNVTIH